jgi:plasmid stabilization system protein ParE
MPFSFELTPRAASDLDDIWNFIAEDSVDAANRVESTILA